MDKKISLKEKNDWFNSLPVEQQRVEIAKDVIAQVNAEKLIARQNAYFIMPVAVELGCNLQEVFEEHDPTCQVCAMGALFVSKVRLGNDYIITKDSGRIYRSSDETDLRSIEGGINSVFEEDQYRLIEVAFEGDDVSGYFEDAYGEYDDELEGSVIQNEDYEEAVTFYHNYYSSNDRLLAIMNNIIANNGTFKP